MAKQEEIIWMDATELAERIRSKQVSPVEVLQAHLDRIEAVNPKVNAIVTMVDGAMEKARAAERAVMAGKRLGPLHGVPITIKDCLNTAGVRTTYGSLLFKDFVPKTDATVVARLKRVGAIFFAKTNTPEFTLDAETSNRVFGRTVNPWDFARSPSGSSGGEAAALACGMTPLGMGSDVGGSIRVPATYCGIVGLKATHGRIPLTGFWPEILMRYMFVGPMTRTVRDNALALSIVAGADGADPYAVPLKAPLRQAQGRPWVPDLDKLPKLRIGWSPEDGYAPVAKVVQRVVAKAAAALADAGCQVEQVSLPWLRKRDYLKEAFDNYAGEAIVELEPIIKGRESDLAPNIARFLSRSKPDFDQFVRSLTGLEELKRDTAAFFQKYDVLLGPSATIVPPLHDAPEHNVDGRIAPRFHGSKNTAPWNVTGSPALSVPFGWTPDGRLPIGVELIGRHFEETTLLLAGAALERAAEGRGRRPPV